MERKSNLLFLILFTAVLTTVAHAEEICHESVTTIPISCENAVKTYDDVTANGCRFVECTNADGVQTVYACDKPDTAEKEYFEAYATSSQQGISTCFADAFCMTDHGFYRSDLFPLCGQGICGNGVLELDEECDRTQGIQQKISVCTNQCKLQEVKSEKEFESLLAQQFLRKAFGQLVETQRFCVKQEDSNYLQFSNPFNLTEPCRDLNPDFMLYFPGQDVLLEALNTIQTIKDVGKDIQEEKYYLFDLEYRNIPIEGGPFRKQVVCDQTIEELYCPFFQKHFTDFDVFKAGYHCCSFGDICTVPVQSMQLNCTGEILEDTYNGCRSITCEDNQGHISMLACNKPDSGDSTHFELYVQERTSDSIKICLDDVCVGNQDFVREKSLTCQEKYDSAFEDTFDPDSISRKTCFSGVQNIPVTCQGDLTTKEEDYFDGCRNIVCQNIRGKLAVRACDKLDNGEAAFFEIYERERSGDEEIDVCFGDTCIGKNGYVKGSEYPYCAYCETTIENGQLIGDTSDLLEIGESIGKVKETLTKDDLKMLRSGRIITSKGITDFSQRLELDRDLQTGIARLDENNNDEVNDFLFFDDGRVFFNLELTFEQGLKSSVKKGVLETLIGEAIFILGTYPVILNAHMDHTGENFALETLLVQAEGTGAIGETNTYEVGTKKYEIMVAAINPSSIEEQPSAIFSVNNEMINEIEEKSFITLPNGLTIYVKEITESRVVFLLGVDMLTLDSYGRVDINEESIEDATVIFDYTKTIESEQEELTIHSINYQLRSDATISTDIYVGEREGIREYLDEPEGMLGDWDIIYTGLRNNPTTSILFQSKGDDEYNLLFTNSRQNQYTVPYVTTKQPNYVQFGDEDNAFIFWEVFTKHTETTLNDESFAISQEDYFLLTEGDQDDKGDSYILQWSDINLDDNTIFFIDTATKEEVKKTFTHIFMEEKNSVAISEIADNPSGRINLNGNSFNFWLRQINGLGQYTLMIDLDADKTIAGADGLIEASDNIDIVNAVVRGGGIITLSDNVTPPGGDWKVTLTTLAEKTDQDVMQKTQIPFTTNDEQEINLRLPTESETHLYQGTWYQERSNEKDRIYGLNGYGTWFETTDETDEANTLRISYPTNQKDAVVYVAERQVRSGLSCDQESE